MESITTAADMARLRGIDPKRFRAALRRAGLQWHSHNGRWEVRVGSPEHCDLVRVLATLGVAPTDRVAVRRLPDASTLPARASSDEAWIIDLCDAVLSMTALRQHRFPFLVGDAGRSGRGALLPVDAYYPELALAVEFHEPQHSRPVGLFDKRSTVSGISRGEQRRRYDDLRRAVLPANGLDLVILDFSEFEHTPAGRLMRTQRDRAVIAQRLAQSATAV